MDDTFFELPPFVWTGGPVDARGHQRTRVDVQGDSQPVNRVQLQARTPFCSSSLADVRLLYLDYDNCLHACDAYKAGDRIAPGARSENFFEFAGVLEDLLAPYPALQIVSVVGSRR